MNTKTLPLGVRRAVPRIKVCVEYQARIDTASHLKERGLITEEEHSQLLQDQKETLEHWSTLLDKLEAGNDVEKLKTSYEEITKVEMPLQENEEEGVEAVVHVRRLAHLKHPKQTALSIWRKMSLRDKVQVLLAYQAARSLVAV